MGRERVWFHFKRFIQTPNPIPSPRHCPAPCAQFLGHLSNRKCPPSDLRFFSLNTAVSGSYSNDWDGEHQECGERQVVKKSQEMEEVRCIPVKSYFLCTSIDLKSMQAENAYSAVPPSSRSWNYVAFRYCNNPLDISGMEVKGNANVYRYMVVFQYGSVVLFNVADNEAENYLEIARKHASGLLLEMRKDDYAVLEKPQLTTWMQGGPDHIVLKNFDMDGIRIIGSVLGQSIALDYFIRQVDGMVEEFTDINRGMEKTGTFTMQRKKLFQLVGKANSNLADVIIKLGLFDRSEIAWKNANYAQILEYLRDEFELTQRFGSLDFKLKFVEHNIHFLQEVLEKRRSDFLEWCVIVLLTIDILISLYEIITESTKVSP